MSLRECELSSIVCVKESVKECDKMLT